jgi:hypothetical protein
VFLDSVCRVTQLMVRKFWCLLLTYLQSDACRACHRRGWYQLLYPSDCDLIIEILREGSMLRLSVMDLDVLVFPSL